MMGFGGCCGGLGWGGYGSFGWIGLIINLVLTLLVFGGLIWLVVWAVRKATGPGSPLKSSSSEALPSPKEVLQIRYARGEISREEYQQMLNDLDAR